LVAVETKEKQTAGETTTKGHLVNFEADEYHTATSKSLKRDEELLMAGFEYVTERDEIKIFRKRK
jgi:hypothetical protein